MSIYNSLNKILWITLKPYKWNKICLQALTYLISNSQNNHEGRSNRWIHIRTQTLNLAPNSIIPSATLHHIGNGYIVEYQLWVSMFPCLTIWSMRTTLEIIEGRQEPLGSSYLLLHLVSGNLGNLVSKHSKTCF